LKFAQKRFNFATSMPEPANHPPRVGIIANNVGGYSRTVIRGVASFAFARAWDCRVEGVNESAIDAARLRKFDGLIIQAATPEQAKLVGRASVPAVNVSSALGLKRVPSVVSDDRAVGAMGADHFLRRGHRSFAFYAPDDRQFATLRFQGFAQRLSAERIDCRRLDDAASMRTFLTTAARPIAVMACNDRSAVALLEICRSLAARVPEDVAVLGVDNDELMQSLANPPLSTINTARERIGFEAAAMLERLMSGQPIAGELVLVPPKDVITRRSTDALAIDDADVVAAARFIQHHAGRQIGVLDVTRRATISRRQLERRFKDSLGRTIHDEILRCRVERARTMLIESDLTLPQIAMASGFASASYFTTVFRRQAGTTPGEFRERVRK
jgi:LacI family transcriptional regulator